MLSKWYNFPDEIDQPTTLEGVYVLSETDSESGIVYVGRADSVRDRLSDHKNPNNPCLQRKNIQYFAYEINSSSEDREQELIGKYDPECND